MASSLSYDSGLNVDYTLYLVTDVTARVLGQRNLPSQVRAACAGGVKIVQHRDKTSDTSTLIRDTQDLHQITKSFGIPLLVNDRVDVALAVGCEGVHLGQEDMDLSTARRLLGPEKLIGISVSSGEEALAAVRGGADYVGIGTMFGTLTKRDTKAIIGTGGTQSVLAAVAKAERERGKKVGTVAIGGINSSNVQRVMYQSASQDPPRPLDGVAVVSALMAVDDPKAAAAALRQQILTAEETTPFATIVYPPDVPSADLVEAYLVRDIPALVARLRATKPLCHNMTNHVVQNFAANVALAIGGSPIMANDGSEAADLAGLGNASLVVNIGSATPGAVEHASRAISAYNATGAPVLFDPVGGGATAIRRQAVKDLLATGYLDLIKGNESEIIAVAASVPGLSSLASSMKQEQQRGVDSSNSGLTLRGKAQLVAKLAEMRRCIVLMTGRGDFLSDGVRVLKVANGHSILGEITGSGCTLGTTIAAFLAVERRDKLLAALTGLLLFEIAAEKAMSPAPQPQRPVATHENAEAAAQIGPGSFVPKFIDELDRISTQGEKFEWAANAKIEPVALQLNGEAS